MSKVKRFVWMAGYTYYASGGFHDFKGEQKAIDFVAMLKSNPNNCVVEAKIRILNNI